MCSVMAGMIAVSALTAAGGYVKAQGQKAAGAAKRSAAQGQAMAKIQEGQANQQALFANAEAAAYQAETADFNKEIAGRLSKDAITRGRLVEQKSRISTQQLIGKQKVALAGSGVVVDQDSALDLTKDTAGIGEFEALTIRANAAREALGFIEKGEGYGRDATLQRMAAENYEDAAQIAMDTGLASAIQLEKAGEYAKSAGKAQAVGTYIDTTSTVAKQWLTYGMMSGGGGGTTGAAGAYGASPWPVGVGSAGTSGWGT